MSYETREPRRKFEHQDNSGIVFTNNDRRPDRQDPHFKGDGKVNGVDCWISVWGKVLDDGRKQLNIKWTPKQEVRRESYDRQRQEDRKTMASDDFF